MPTFKSKNFKKLHSDTIIESLDHRHTEFLYNFEKNDKVKIPDFLNEREILYKKFNDTTTAFEEKLDIKDKIKDIDQKIKNLKREKKDYFLKNSNILFQYFEEKKNISNLDSCNVKSLDNFFNIKNKDEDQENNKPDNNLKKYFANIDSNYLDINNYIHPLDICRHCNKGELIPIDHEGILVCNNCYCHVKFLIENEKPNTFYYSNNEEPNKLSDFEINNIFKSII